MDHPIESTVFTGVREIAAQKIPKNPAFFAIFSLQGQSGDYMIEEDWETLEHMFAFLFETFYGQIDKKRVHRRPNTFVS